jgi:uncharacterized OsmC-like protein
MKIISSHFCKYIKTVPATINPSLPGIHRHHLLFISAWIQLSLLNFNKFCFLKNCKTISMDAIELRNLQAPLKEKYKAEPGSAMITLKAKGNIAEGISCKVETGQALVEAGLHPATGGSGLLACSGDLLLEALVACAGVTLKAVATAIGVEIKNGTIRAQGDLDFRGTLGVSKETPVGFQAIRLYFDLDTDASVEQMESIAKLTERYCVVFQTLARGVNIQPVYKKLQA